MYLSRKISSATFGQILNEDMPLSTPQISRDISDNNISAINRLRIITSYPANGGVLKPGNELIFTFNKNISFSTTDGTYYIRIRRYVDNSIVNLFLLSVDNGDISEISEDITIENGNELHILIPSFIDFIDGDDYYITMTKGFVIDSVGYKCGISKTSINAIVFEFSTVRIVSISPNNNSTEIEVDSNLIIEFDGAVKFNTDETAKYLRVYATGNTVPIDVFVFQNGTCNRLSEVSGNNTNIIEINSVNNLYNGVVNYIVFDDGCFVDDYDCVVSGINIPSEWSFATVNPTVYSVLYSPLDNATGVAVDQTLQITFNENISLGSGNLYLWNLTTNEATLFLTISSGISVSNEVLSINPSSNLLNSNNYYVLMDAGFVKSAITGDTAIGIKQNTQWNFTTA